MATYLFPPLPPQSIRLLHLLPGGFDDPLRGELSITRFDPDGGAILEYEALSYVWGAQASSEVISFDKPSGSLQIGRNLASALRHLRHHDRPRVIWCDLVCIDQVNFQERASQILRMRDIYPRAKRVVAWLGPEADNSNLALETLEFASSFIGSPDQKEKTPQRPVYKDLNEMPDSWERWQAIAKLISRIWFKRLWVRQEIALASTEALAVVGGKQIFWWQLTRGVQAITADEYLPPNIDDWASFKRDIVVLIMIRRMKHSVEPDILIQFTKMCDCADDRDRVYAILGLSSKEICQAINVDYRLGVKAVFKSFFLSHIRTQSNFSLFSFCNSATRPTWVPDLQKLKESPTRSFWLGRATASAPPFFRLLDGDGDKAEVSGVRCDTIAEFLGSVPLDCDGNDFPTVVTGALKRFLGASSESWSLQALASASEAVVAGEVLERIARHTKPRRADIAEVLRAWACGDMAPGSRDSYRRFSMNIFLAGRSMYRTQGGYFFLGPNKCQPGDQVYSILGFDRNLVLRPITATTHLVIGQGYHSTYADGEALLGELPPEWKVTFIPGEGYNYSPAFEKDGQIQKQDPRLADMRLPDSWEEGVDENGDPRWRFGKEGQWTKYDPRLSHEELMKRGIKAEKIVLE